MWQGCSRGHAQGWVWQGVEARHACLGHTVCPPQRNSTPLPSHSHQVHISGDEWALRGALHNPRLRYRVHLGSELSSGGESTDPCTAELTFSAECLTRL